MPAWPKPAAQPFRWAWTDIRPQLLRAGTVISAAEAERRVLVLENPGLPGRSQVTDTLYAGVQLILPGEIAPAHRHTQSALRFVLEGEGGFTAVDGERTTMHRGDFIITPHWTWHDHGHDGDGPVIWMDGLDVPLVAFLHAGFREEHTSDTHLIARPEGDALARYGSGLLPVGLAGKSSTSPVFNYPYSRTREALDRLARHTDIDPQLGICLRYVNPTTGDWAIPTIGATMRLIPRGYSTRPYQSTESTVIAAVEGEVSIEVDAGAPLRLMPNDVFALPGWRKWRLIGGSDDAILFTFSDRPVHEKLGLFREHRG
ncbi:MAG: gentisate 1,2-dioxygenase [Steroidobacteraceae bacterium]